MFRYFFFQLSHQVVVFIKEFWIFLDFTLGFADFGKVIFIMTIILDEGVVFLMVHLEHDDGVGELWELDSFLEEANSSLLESDPADSIIWYSSDFNFLSSHCIYEIWSIINLLFWFLMSKNIKN